ncbi:hypothetical protein D3C79_1060740 [compost metagenome]
MTIPAICKVVTVSLKRITDTITAIGNSTALNMDDIPNPTLGTAIVNKKTGIIMPNNPNANP